jgi:hypothetical protein
MEDVTGKLRNRNLQEVKEQARASLGDKWEKIFQEKINSK